MTESQKICPCCNKSAPATAFQCVVCGYDYRTRLEAPQAQAELIKTHPPVPNSFAPLVFLPPTLILPAIEPDTSVLGEAELLENALVKSKPNLPFVMGTLGAALVTLLLLVGMIQVHRRTPGPEAQALAAHMKPYEFTSEKQFTSLFGQPTTQDAKAGQSTPYDYWNYKCSDGSAVVTYNTQLKRVEQVSATQ